MTAELTIACFKWKPNPGYGAFPADAVNVLRKMVARHYHLPHRFICITDDPTGIDDDVEIFPLWNDYANLPNPFGRAFPSCYRRLRLFNGDLERCVSLDLDTVIVGDVTPLWERPEAFVAWRDPLRPNQINGSMVLFTSAACRRLWEAFDPIESPKLAKAANYFGSDQAWISFCLNKGYLGEAAHSVWGKEHGVLSYRVDCAKGLPANAKIVFFHGPVDPWSAQAQSVPWVKNNWH